jgi:hypothetical protein
VQNVRATTAECGCYSSTGFLYPLAVVFADYIIFTFCAKHFVVEN